MKMFVGSWMMVREGLRRWVRGVGGWVGGYVGGWVGGWVCR